jgi:hypothetical protein
VNPGKGGNVNDSDSDDGTNGDGIAAGDGQSDNGGADVGQSDNGGADDGG